MPRRHHRKTNATQNRFEEQYRKEGYNLRVTRGYHSERDAACINASDYDMLWVVRGKTETVALYGSKYRPGRISSTQQTGTADSPRASQQAFRGARKLWKDLDSTTRASNGRFYGRTWITIDHIPGTAAPVSITMQGPVRKTMPAVRSRRFLPLSHEPSSRGPGMHSSHR
jgi:hypothetical protein